MDLETQNRYYTYESAPQSPELNGLGITPRKLRRDVGRGRIGHFRLGQRVHFSPSDLQQYRDNARIEATR